MDRYIIIGLFFAAFALIFYRIGYRAGRTGALRDHRSLHGQKPALYSTVSPNKYEEVITRQRAIATAFEIERRRIERDLHDGVQQYLVATSMDVGEALLMLEDAGVKGADIAQVIHRLHSAQYRASTALTELRKTVAGIHPKVLSDLGLAAAVEDLAAVSPLRIDVKIPHELPPLPEGVVAAAYFTIAEALTNAAKYAPQADVTILISVDDNLRLSIVDTGPGGAEIRPGGGFAGIQERLETFGGHCTLSSPEGGPTIVSASIPLMLRRGEFSNPTSPDVPPEEG